MQKQRKAQSASAGHAAVEVSKASWWYVPRAAWVMAEAFARHAPAAWLVSVLSYPNFLVSAVEGKLRGKLYAWHGVVGVVSPVVLRWWQKLCAVATVLVVLAGPYFLVMAFAQGAVWLPLLIGSLFYMVLPLLTIFLQGAPRSRREGGRKDLLAVLGPAGVELGCLARGKKSESGDGKRFIVGLSNEYQRLAPVGLVAHTDRHVRIYRGMGYRQIGDGLGMEYKPAGDRA
ncbi:hypothetical protein ACIGB6_14395 [Paeniglutamicibacter gangotriensis]|uniref:hypothetical protein n=1 Tax=Paeniglutamicibacter gangotriensis TaxID=254787 RepID=UPI0037C69EEA